MPHKYFQKTKQDSEKKHVKDIKIFLKKKKTKSGERLVKDIKIIVNDIEIILKIKSRSQLSIDEIII